MAGTVIGEGLTIQGELVGDEDVEVRGTVSGRLASPGGTVTVVAGGVVDADIEAGSVAVAGQVTGNVTVGDRIDIHSGGRLVGDVRASRLTIADGASFKGNVDMEV